jgi:CRISPR-associated protein Csm2
MSFERKGKDRQSQPEEPAVYQECESFLKKCSSLKEAKAEELLKFVDKIGEHLAKTIGMSQLRKVLDSFDKIKSAVRTRKEGISVGEEIQPLKIHLAYAAGRESALKPLHKVLSVAIDKVQDREDFRKFSQFIEGLVAYHKFHGGKEERR